MAEQSETGDPDPLPPSGQEKVADVNIPLPEQKELTQIQEPETMEVHHHAHAHGNKTWRTYAWEFVMLFLAVFCGFMAEYFLEHRIEKERGRQYVQSMIEDLASDSIKINEKLLTIKKQQLGLDSLALSVSKRPYDDNAVKSIYSLMLAHTWNNNSVGFTKRTITQLRNSGGMRLIPNKTSADEITIYSELVEKVESQGEYYSKSVMDIMKLNQKIFYLSTLRELNNEGFWKPHTMKLATKNEELLTEYANLTIFTSLVMRYYSQDLEALKIQIPKTIEILKRENGIE